MTEQLVDDPIPFTPSLRYLAGVSPALASKIEGCADTITQPVIENGSVIDIDIGHGRLYGKDGKDFATEQVAGFLEQPNIILLIILENDKSLIVGYI